jgi:transcriptional regulator with XRE-family HTH domain
MPTESDLNLRQREFGRLVRRLRERQKLSLRSVARALSVSPAFLSKAERGMRDLAKPRFVNMLANLLKQDVSWLREQARLDELTLEGGLEELVEIAGKFQAMADEGGKDRDAYRLVSPVLWTIVDVIRPALDHQDVQPLANTFKVLLTTVHRWAAPEADLYSLYSDARRHMPPAEETLGSLLDRIVNDIYNLHRKAVERKLGIRLPEGR